jgi:GT2 family glycosyltransferase
MSEQRPDAAFPVKRDRMEQLFSKLETQHMKVGSEAPLVSVCIAAYNHEAYLAECIESVLAQTYANIEVIVVDDASSDTTPDIIRTYAERFPQRVRAILLKQNEGPACASNRAFGEAGGEYIALLGSDDRMLPTRIQRQVQFLQASPHCVGVFSDIDAIDEAGNGSPQLAGTEMLFNQPIVHLRRQLLTGNFLNAPSALLRKADLLAVGGYIPVLRYVQDYELWGRLLARGELAKLPERLTEYRVHGANLSVFGVGGPIFAARCETVATIVQFVRRWPLETLLERPLQSDADRAAALLELAAVLELVDRHYFGKPLLACAQAYELTLQASQLAPEGSRALKVHLEACLDGGFAAQGPLSGEPVVWFEEPYALLSRGLPATGDRPGSGAALPLKDWLAARLPSPVQQGLIGEYLVQQGGGLRFGILILDLQGDSAKLMTTIKSLGLDKGLYATLKIVALSAAQVPATSPTDKLHFIRVEPGNYVSVLNSVASEGGFDWLMLVQAGEEFTASGLMMIALELLGAPECRAVYGDELQRMPDGTLGAAFRPGFNLDLLLSFPAVMARHWLIRRDVFIDIGGFNAKFEGALEFELLLRLIEQGGMVGLGHVDEPLLITEAPVLGDNPGERLALLRHLQQRGYTKAELLPYLPGRYRIRYGHQAQPLVSIIIPTKDQLPILQRCVESLLEKTRYPHYELLIVDNNSETPEAREWLAGIESLGEAQLRVLRYPYPFNYSAINNMAVGEARGEYLVLLNNDTAIIRENWLDELLNHAQRPEVGIVGAKLLYPDGRIQHAGVLLGLRGPADHPFIGEPMDAPGYMQRLQVDQNYSAVTAACLMIRKSVYEDVGGMDEVQFKVSYNDVDLCLKVREAGYLSVWTPHAVVLHEGSVSQTKIDPKAGEAKRKRFLGEQDAMYDKWLPLLARDPAYNRNLSLNGRGFDLEPDVQLTWRPLTWKPLPVVLAHPADPYGCGNYRVIQPFKAQQEAGLIEGMLSPGLLHVVDLERYDPDVIVLQRQIGDDRLEAMRRIKAFSRAFKVYELDDYLPNLPIKSVHRAAMPKDILQSLRKGFGYVDRFVVSTEPLAEAFAGLHDDIRVIENRLPVHWWKGLTSQRRRGSKARVGWAGGIGHTGDLELIADVIKALAGEVEWVFFGLCPEKIRPYVHEVHVGVDIEAYPQALASLDLDLALAPVEQNLFNECKSNLRLLEYGACGFPVICSDVRCYRDALPVTRVKNRFKDWVDAIRMHINDLDAAAKAGDELRAQVLDKWMLQAGNVEAWRAAWLPD